MRKTTLFFGLIILALTTFGQSQYLSFQNGLMSKENQKTLPSRTVTTNNATGVTIEFNFTGAFVSETKVKDTTYNYLNIDGIHKMGTVGSPAVPAKNEIIAIPRGVKARIKIINSDYKEYSGFYIHPALKPARDTEGAPAPEFKKDTKVYSKNAFFPSNVVDIVKIGRNRGTGLAYTQIRPIQFNPITKTVRVYTNIKFEIIYEGSSSFDYIATENTKHFTNLLKQRVLNSDMIPNGLSFDQEVKDGDAKNYIIITHSEYSEQAEALANWKRQLGYSVEVVAQNSWTATEVKAAISTRYQNWIPKPDYFVIIGDHTGNYAVPGEIYTDPYYNEPFATDLYYACMDGASDWHPDIARGRISVSNAEEATVVINKIINYELNPPAQESFYENGLACSQFQDKVDDYDTPDGYAARRFCHTSEEIQAYMTAQQGYTVNRVYYTDPANTPTNFNDGHFSNGEAIPDELLRSNGFDWDGDENDITAAINAGKFYVFHRDHGYVGGSGWAHPYYTTSTMESLSNGENLPVVFSMNCHTGEFQLDNCFAEKFVRMENKGAVGVVAAAYFSLSGYNDALAVGMIDAIWADPGVYPVMGTSGSGNNYTIGTQNSIYTMGDVLYQGLYAMEQNIADQGAHQYGYELFHWFSDPAMQIWTSNPNNNIISANHESTISCDGTSFNISDATPNAIATLVFSNHLIGQAIVDESGNATIEYAIIEAGSEATVTISMHNHKPYTETITVTGTCDFPPQVSTLAITDITETEATLNGEITDDGGATITESGFVYNTNGNPQIGEDGVIQIITNPTTTSGSFTIDITGLSSNTTYYVKSYAINNSGTSYGNAVTFSTLCGVFSTLPFVEDFAGGLATCWENVDNDGSGQIWQFNNPAGRDFQSTTAANGFAMLDSDNYGSGTNQDADLITPTLDLTNYSSVNLTFEHTFKSYSNSAAALSYSIDGGMNWTEIQNWIDTDGSLASPAIFNEDLSTEIAGQSNVLIKWNYIGNYGYYWAIDDIEVTGEYGNANTVSFEVTSQPDQEPLENTTININGSTITTNIAGIATIDLPDGSYPYTTTKEGYASQSGTIEVAGEPIQEFIELEKYYLVTFNVVLGNTPAVNAQIEIENYSIITTNTQGIATIELTNGTYNYTVSVPNYSPFNDVFTIIDQDQTVDIVGPFPTYAVNFNVLIGESPVEDAIITINDEQLTTNNEGTATIDLPNGDYPFICSFEEYDNLEGAVNVNNEDVTRVLNFTGIDNFQATQVNIYPNPNSGVFTIDLPGTFEVSVFNAIGKLIFNKTTSKETTIKLTDVSSGIYLVKIQTQNTSIVKQIIIKQ